MSKEIINKDGTLFKQRTTPDWQEGYEQGLLAGTTRAIARIRDLQRDYGRWDEGNAHAILNEARDLIAENIK